MGNADRCIINSLLDQDLYKFSMQNAVFTLFPDAVVEYRFINRGEPVWGARFVERLKDQIKAYCDLKFAPVEVNFLRRECPYLSQHYLEWLEGYQPDPAEVCVEGSGSNFLGLTIRGPWYRTILWEVPLMALISELRYRCDPLVGAGVILDHKDDIKKASRMSRIAPYSDFGTRRRYSLDNHRRIVEIHSKYGGHNFMGTSNVLMAKDFGLQPIGTMAHEWIMFHGAACGVEHANEIALRNWYNVYRGNLGIALTDTYTSDWFFDDVSAEMAMVYDGIRQDSGDPIEFAYKAADFYRKYGINSASKTVIFSDGLTVDRAEEIAEKCRGVVKVAFGIGTHFTNDVGLPPMNMVIKMWAAARHYAPLIPTVKLSDVPGKHTGEKQQVEHAEWLIGKLVEGGM